MWKVRGKILIVLGIMSYGMDVMMSVYEGSFF